MVVCVASESDDTSSKVHVLFAHALRILSSPLAVVSVPVLPPLPVLILSPVVEPPLLPAVEPPVVEPPEPPVESLPS